MDEMALNRLSDGLQGRLNLLQMHIWKGVGSEYLNSELFFFLAVAGVTK